MGTAKVAVSIDERLLREMDGFVELTVKAAYREDAILREIVQEQGAVRQLRRRTSDRPPDASHFERIRLGELVVGALARLLVPGPDPMGIGLTILVGLCGTFSAGLFSWYVLHRHGGGLILSVLFSMLVVWLYRRSRGWGRGGGPGRY